MPTIKEYEYVCKKILLFCQILKFENQLKSLKTRVKEV